MKPRTIITSRNEAARPLRHPATEAMNRIIIAGLTIALLASPVPARAFSMVCQEAAYAAEEAAKDRHQMDEVTVESGFIAYYEEMSGTMPEGMKEVIHQSMVEAYHNEASPKANYNAAWANCLREYGGN